MFPFRRLSPPSAARPGARSLHHWPAALALALCPLMSSAQVRSEALLAADPLSPVAVRALAAPPSAPAATPERPNTAAEALVIWQRANQQVAAFPRGHIDILRRESSLTDTPTPPTADNAASPLQPSEALRLSLAQRPTLWVQPGMNTVEQAMVQRAWLDHAHEVQRAWVTAVASRESLRHQQARLDAARSGAELGHRMVETGNWSQARLLREQLAQSREQAAQLQAQQTLLAAQEHLARLMGQWNPRAINALVQRLPTQLPELPTQPATGVADSDIETAVLRSHPTLAVQRNAAQRQLAALDPAWRENWAQALQASLRTLPSAGMPARPLAINDPRLANDHALQRALGAEAALLQTATERRSAARTAWAQLQTTHALARHAQDVTLPLQTALEQETQLRYNGMLQSTWELLEASRERMQAASDAASARRDFWLAQADWNNLLAGGDYTPAEPSSSTGGASAPASTAGH